jgi:uncharacterized cupredoxin-like copper-binding protein
MSLLPTVAPGSAQRGPRRWGVLGSVLLIALVSAACGRTGSTQVTGPVDVQITLTGSKISSSLTTFTVGVPYHFIVTNTDTINQHEFMVIPPAPPTTSSADLDKSTIVHIEEVDLPAGAKQTIDYTFTQAYATGTLEMACHLPGHYELGMRLPIIVK